MRYGVRMLLKQKGTTLIAILSLALGIGANTALFSIVDALLLKRLPVEDPDRLVLFTSLTPREFNPGGYMGNSRRDPATGQSIRSSFPYQTFKRFRDQKDGPLTDVMAFADVTVNLNAGGQAEVVRAQAVSDNYFQVLGVRPLLGRTFNQSDDSTSSPPVAIISFRYWQQRFGESNAIVGSQVNLNNIAFRIIGITPPGFEGASQAGSTRDISVPISWEPQLAGARSRMNGAGAWWLRMMGRLKPGATGDQAALALNGLFQQTVVEHRKARQEVAIAQQSRVQILDITPGEMPKLTSIPGGQGEMNTRDRYRRPLYILFGVVVLVLLIACANVANLLLARGASREQEIGVRLALGASRWRIVRQMLTESLLLSVIGGLAGIMCAVWIKDGLFAVTDWGGQSLRALEPKLDLRVLAFTFGIAVLTGILFGLAPALRSTKVNVAPTLKETSRGTVISRSLLSRSLVVIQVSLSLILMIGAIQFVRTLINLQRVDPGFNTQNLLLFGVEPRLIGYKDDKLAQLYKDISMRLEAIPGVRNVTFSQEALLSFSSSDRSVFLGIASMGKDGQPIPNGGVSIHRVRENFPSAMEIPLLAGRNLTTQDDTKAPRVVLVNQTFAKKYFGDENPLGRRFSFDFTKPDSIEIVGLLKDSKYTSKRDDVVPTAYIPWQQELQNGGSATFEIRTMGDPLAIVSAVREAVKNVDSNLPVDDLRTQVAQVDQTLSMERLFARLMTLFGVLAQQLSSIGLYGVIAYSVAQRTREIGVRMALGAKQGNVLRMILRQGMVLALIGVALGTVGAWLLIKYLETNANLNSMLFRVTARDPVTFVAVAVLLTIIALLACYIPARRASRVDPMVALRYE